jgi:hypothetical protein
MKTIRWSLGTLLVAGVSATTATGCEKKTIPADAERVGAEPRAAPDTAGARGRTQVASTSQNRAAVESITAARCDREQRCNNIGSGKKYESRPTCVTNVRSDWQGELTALECPNGIEQQRLDTCLDRLRTDGCANPVETLGRVAACRQAELCRAG